MYDTLGLLIAVLIVGGCVSSKTQAGLSVEAKLRRAEVALLENRTFEAKDWLSQTLKTQPHHPKAQSLMAKVIEHEFIREKSFAPEDIPEELTPQKKEQQIKTWLERGHGFLEINQFNEALRAAEQIFQLDPENLEASRLIDEIKERAQKQGREEDLFLQGVYQQEINARIHRYTQQAEAWIQEKKWGAARFAAEKILILDPKNPQGHRLLAQLDGKEKAA